VGLVMEPVNHLQVGFNTTVAEVRAMVARVGSPRLRPMVDTLHMNIEERSLVEPIHALGADLGHVHLCETNGGIFGSAHIDFAAVLRALDDIGYTGFIAVKVYRNATWGVGAATAYDVVRRARSGTAQ
jgi:D-psicose/D-tagatose/L-ribulose 3-epimerase